ncbi:MAG: outer membrane beta-barrel protein, partial [Xanthobacteraceae bacterium]|nr:outer membrane beta-barrel protein [Xanthobacteraceae bacterium]
MAGPARVRDRRARFLGAALPCLALIALSGTKAEAQTVTPDLFSPTRSSQITSADSPLRRTTADANTQTPDATGDARPRDRDPPAPSRIGQTPRYGTAAASGASDWGYDSLNRKRKLQKYYPGQAKPKPPVGPGNPPRPVASNAPQRLSVAPSQSANKAPIAPAMAGTVVGQPQRKRLRVDDDPFGAVGDYAGSFLIKSALELSAGYDTNPRRTAVPGGSPLYVVAPEFLAVSDWERH